jgi:crotonobetainyl-CoA:carnitine CoA-transferase CaiB-like acyl-CoA transferase
LSALNARHTTGKGQKVSVSLLETGVAALANVAANHLATGKEAGRYGNGHPNIVPYTTYPSADGELALAVGNDGQFRAFAEVAGKPEWGKDPRFAKNADRVRNRIDCDAAVAEAVKLRPTQWWIDKLRAAGVPCGSVNKVSQALADPQSLARGMVMEMQHPTAGALKMLGFPIKLSETPAAATKAPPLLGQHTVEVLAGDVGLTAAEIEALRKAGAI